MTATDNLRATNVSPPWVERETRARAASRSWICPGSGFAQIGHAPAAIAMYGVSLGVLPVLVWFASDPSAASLWTTVAMLVVYGFLWFGEQIAARRAKLGPSGPAVLVSGYVAASAVMWLAYAAGLILLLASFGGLRMGGAGMSPTIEMGERLVYHKHVDWRRVQPGAVVVYRNPEGSAWGQPGLIISRILAGPGDKLSIQDAHYVVNGTAGPRVADAGRFKTVVDVPSAPKTLTVPEGSYFVVQDSPTGGIDSRVLSWVRTGDIVSSRLWHCGAGGICKSVQ
jgi:signal peptidase I